MKKIGYICLMFAAVSCAGKQDGKPVDVALDSEGVAQTQAVKGEWMIEDVVVNDTLCLRASDRSCYFNFHDDGTFGISTNCNSFGGEYRLCGDSISFANVCWTEIACDDMAMEEVLKEVLPDVCAIDFINDSVAQLNANATQGSRIVIKKSSDW